MSARECGGVKVAPITLHSSRREIGRGSPDERLRQTEGASGKRPSPRFEDSGRNQSVAVLERRLRAGLAADLTAGSGLAFDLGAGGAKAASTTRCT